MSCSVGLVVKSCNYIQAENNHGTLCFYFDWTKKKKRERENTYEMPHGAITDVLHYEPTLSLQVPNQQQCYEINRYQLRLSHN